MIFAKERQEGMRGFFYRRHYVGEGARNQWNQRNFRIGMNPVRDMVSGQRSGMTSGVHPLEKKNQKKREGRARAGCWAGPASAIAGRARAGTAGPDPAGSVQSVCLLLLFGFFLFLFLFSISFRTFAK
jgi:hypothetical protein